MTEEELQAYREEAEYKKDHSPMARQALQLLDEIDRLRMENERYRKALEPFADERSWMKASDSECTVIAWRRGYEPWKKPQEALKGEE